MAVVEIQIKSMSGLHDAVIETKYAGPTSATAIPCATANNGELCKNATLQGCAAAINDKSTISFSKGINCPEGLGVVTATRPVIEKQPVAK